MNWTQYFLEMAYLVAKKSRDESTKCGCVITGPDHEIRTTGYNGLPRGLDYSDEVHERPGKYKYFEHAERNAIYNAARMGLSLRGCVAYVTGPPCTDCARAIIQSGIMTVIYPKRHNLVGRDDWEEDLSVAKSMLLNCGLFVREVDYEVGTNV